MAAIEPTRYNNLKARIKAECQRRAYTGSVATYGGASYDYTTKPAKGGKIAFVDSNVTLYCYSEAEPEDSEIIAPADLGIDTAGITGIGFWRYSNGKATPWN
jgi:hypothetical protein